MKRILSAVTALGGLTVATIALAEPLAGYDHLSVAASHRPAPVAASVWYPMGTSTYPVPIGDNALFKGVKAYVGAGVAEGRYPLVLVSHGSGGNMDGLGWLSSGLALRGAIVLAVNHPGTTSGDSSPRRTIRFDERAADLRAALDTVLSDPAFAPHIDASRIAVLGFSLGGATALNLAGTRFDRDLYRDYCARLSDQPDCVFLRKGGVNIANLPSTFESDTHDPRIASAVAVDPAFTYAATADSIRGVTVPVLLINQGGPERFKAIDVTATGSDLLGRLPHADYAVVEPAGHFTFLAECKPGAHDRLVAEKDDPIGTDRARAHAAMIDRIAAFLRL